MTRLELQIFLAVVAAVAILQAAAAALRPGGSIGLGIAIAAAVTCIVACAFRRDRTERNTKPGDD